MRLYTLTIIFYIILLFEIFEKFEWKTHEYDIFSLNLVQEYMEACNE